MLACCLLVQGQAQRPGRGGGRGAGGAAPPPLHATILAVFDTSKDGLVTLEEIESTLDGLAGMAAMGMGGGSGGGSGGDSANDLAVRVHTAKKHAPMLLKFMDADGSGALSEAELGWVTKAHARMKKSLKDLARDVFDAIDTDPDESISPAEEKGAVVQPVLGQVLGLLESDFPMPTLSPSVGEAATPGNLAIIFGMLDGDADGSVSRKEAYRAVASVKKQFLEAATLLETMGPMLAMFGGGMDGGRGGAGGARRAGGRGVSEKPSGGGKQRTHNVKVARPSHEIKSEL